MTGRGFAAALVLFLTLGSTAACGARSRPPSTAPPQPHPAADIVVQGAVDTELQPLLGALEGREQIQIAAWTFWRGRIAGKTVVVSRTEVGPVNASTATTLAIVNFRPRLIINQGTAGAAVQDLKLFDIVVGEATVDYGAFRSTHADAGAGVDLSRWTPVPHRLRLDGKDRVAFDRFPGDPDMVAAALEVPNPRGRVVKGIIGTAYQFNREVDRLMWMNKTYGVVSEDMESAFAAGTAAGFKTPFVAIRIISDSDFHAAEFQPVAGEYCAAFVLELIRKWSVREPLPSWSQASSAFAEAPADSPWPRRILLSEVGAEAVRLREAAATCPRSPAADWSGPQPAERPAREQPVDQAVDRRLKRRAPFLRMASMTASSSCSLP